MTVEVCVSCEEAIRQAPVYFDGDAYCCTGCVAGGPCQCTYAAETETPPAPTNAAPMTTAPSPPSPYIEAPAQPSHPMSAPHAQASTPAWSPEDEVRQPIPFRRLGAQTIVMHARGFRGQGELLRFAALVERSSTFAEVSLTRVATTEAWFTLSALSIDDVVQTLVDFEGFQMRVTSDQNLVEVDVHAPADPAVPSVPSTRPVVDIPPSAPVNEGEALLPPRPRFRVFRPTAPEAQTPPAAQVSPQEAPSPAAPPPVAPVPPSPTPVRRDTPAAYVPAPAPEVTPSAPAAPPEGPPGSAMPSPPAAMRRPPAAPAPSFASTSQPATAPAPGAPRTPAASQPPRPAPERAPYQYEDGDQVVVPEERPGGAVATVEHLTLVVYPFHSFAALNDFQAAVRTLHGVTNTRVRRFYRGTLHLAVDYEDMIPLGERIRDLKAFAFEVASESRSEIELVLQDSGLLVAAGDK